ncbi:MAG: hypothetical protein QG671_3436, partial [Actinomycetota bacterium]|nr:hypothetical protein [Actinomycetota bacterium]
MTGQDRWNAAYAEGDRTRSWYQPEADVSLDLIASGGGVDRSVVDVGGGASVLVDDLLVADLLTWSPDRTFDVWHDRAVLHFLTEPDQIEAYRAALSSA